MWWKWLLGVGVLIMAFTLLSRDWVPVRTRILGDGPGPVDENASQELTELSSGLKYRILRRGTGAKPKPMDTVTVNFASWMNNGQVVENTYHEKPQELFLNGCIRGLVEGLQLLGEGGMIELQIPATLAYSDKGDGGKVPPHAALNYIVELLEVTPHYDPKVMGPQDPDAPEEFTTTESGLKYRILRKGNGSHLQSPRKAVVSYKGWLDDGHVFDNSYARGEWAIFGPDDGIPGWKEGLQLVSEGGMIELEIPSELAYGEEGTVGIPPDATLHFLIELLEIR